MRIPVPRTLALSTRSLARFGVSVLERRILGDISGRLHGSIFPRCRRVPVRGSTVEPDVGRSVGPARSAGLAVRSPLQAALTFRVRTARALPRSRAQRACAFSPSHPRGLSFSGTITATFRGRAAPTAGSIARISRAGRIA